MRIGLNKELSTPLYRQVENHLRQSIESGKLKTGTKLPSIREMAGSLGINRMTVETAYQHLEADGLIEKRRGSGTYVLPFHSRTQTEAPKRDWPLWQFGPLGKIKPEFADFQKEPTVNRNDIPPITFAGGTGDPNLFPINEFGKTMQQIIKRDGVASLSYGEPNGYLPLRTTICQILASQGQQVDPENILITTGSQQAITLTSLLLLKPGDTVITETPTYSGAIDLFKAFHVNVVGIPLDNDGMQVELLEEKLQKLHPKLIYTIPNFQNPTGISMIGHRRRLLLNLAEKYNVPILEDDYVGDLRYEGCALPSLKSLDRIGQVIYTSTFSKLLMSDIRVGYIISEGPFYNKLVNLKCLNDLATPNLLQRSLEAYLSVGRYQSHLRKTIRIYKKRRNFTLTAIKEILGDRVSCHPPKGGFFIWLTFSKQIDPAALQHNTKKYGIYIANIFQMESEPFTHQFRLNFSYQPEDKIEEGLKRLRKAIDETSMS